MMHTIIFLQIRVLQLIAPPLFGSNAVLGQVQTLVPEIHTGMLKTCNDYMNDTCSVATMIMKVQLSFEDAS